MSQEIDKQGERQPEKKETPLERLYRQIEEQSTENMLKGSAWNFHYAEAAGSDRSVMEEIEKAWMNNFPFGLKCQRSRIVFIPSKLKAFWLWNDNTPGPVFTYKDREDMLNSIRFQYLGHKEFISIAELAALSKIILYTHAIENLESWRSKVLPEPGEPSGSLVSSTGRILPGRAD